MPQYQGFKIVIKIPVDSKEILSLVYTPGVGSSCLKISENPELTQVLTNKLNSVAVIAFDYEIALKRALFLKSALMIDAYPLCVKDSVQKDDLKLVVENIEPNFCGIDLSQIAEFAQNIDFQVQIPVLTRPVPDLRDFFGAISRNIFKFDPSKLSGTTNEKSLELHELAGGVIETELTGDKRRKPLAVISDGTSVLGFGNIGAEASIPVLEGKIALYSELAQVDAIPLALKTQNPDEIIKIAQILADSFSGIHLEDIAAPACFKVENSLIETLKIPVFHDDQHGSAIIVLAGLLNSLVLEKKELSGVKIVINGAGAAGSATARLLAFAGAKNIKLCDINGAVYPNRPENDENLEELAKLTNPDGQKSSLSEIIKGADVFIGLSKGNILTDEMVLSMAENPVIFALANPIPEIMPDKAEHDGAYIVATGRSDFPNQINNSLAFPGLLKGVLDAGLERITDEIKLECALTIASLVPEDELSREKIVPDGLDMRVTQSIVAMICAKFRV